MGTTIKVLVILCLSMVMVSFSKISPDYQENPDYCSFSLETERSSSTIVNDLGGATLIGSVKNSDKVENQLLLSRMDNGRGQGSFQYINPMLPIGDEHRYAIVEYGVNSDDDQPNGDSRIFPGKYDSNGELVFDIADLDRRGTFDLYKVLTIEEVVECNQYLNNKIDMDSKLSVDGLIYIPLDKFGIMERFAIGIKAPEEDPSGKDNSNKSEQDESMEDDSEDENGDGSCPPGYGSECSDWNPDGSWGEWGKK